MGKKVGKATPVWYNAKQDRVVCGTTIQEALGVGYAYDPEPDWKQAVSLPAEKRVVIHNGMCLPLNDITRQLAASTTGCGAVFVRAYGRLHTYVVKYVDATRVIIE